MDVQMLVFFSTSNVSFFFFFFKTSDWIESDTTVWYICQQHKNVLNRPCWFHCLWAVCLCSRLHVCIRIPFHSPKLLILKTVWQTGARDKKNNIFTVHIHTTTTVVWSSNVLNNAIDSQIPNNLKIWHWIYRFVFSIALIDIYAQIV